MAVGPEIIVAHRGFGADAQAKYGVAEHSLAAYDLAIQKAEANIYVDLDAQWAKDGEDLITMHDATLERTTNGTGKVRDRSMTYMKGLKLEIKGIDKDGNNNDDNLPYGPPSIKQSLDFLKDKKIGGLPVKVALEMKGDDWTKARVGKLKTILQNRGMFNSRVNVHSFNNQNAKWAKELGFVNVAYVAPSAGPVPSVTAVKAVGNNVFIRHPLMTQAVADKFNNAGIKIWMWTADEPAEYDKALKYDIYALITDDLIEAQDYLEAAV